MDNRIIPLASVSVPTFALEYMRVIILKREKEIPRLTEFLVLFCYYFLQYFALQLLAFHCKVWSTQCEHCHPSSRLFDASSHKVKPKIVPAGTGSCANEHTDLLSKSEEICDMAPWEFRQH